MSDTEEDYDQGTWEHIKPEPKRYTGRADGKAPRNFIDVDAFRRLVKRGFDGRPKDARPEDDGIGG